MLAPFPKLNESLSQALAMLGPVSSNLNENNNTNSA